MPASSSSPISPVIDQLEAVGTSLGDDLPDALTVLNAIGDTRKRRGVRHQLAAVVGLALCAVLAGARSFVAIAEWAADADRATLAKLGIWETVPCESTFRRVLQSLDAQALDERLGEWSLARSQPVADMQRVIAIDGKTRCAAPPGVMSRGGICWQLSTTPTVSSSARSTSKRKRTRSPCSPPCPTPFHCSERSSRRTRCTPSAGTPIISTAGERISCSPSNAGQPKLHAQLAALPWRDVPVGDLTRDRGHGRVETRQLKVTAVSIGLLFPHAVQAIQIRRRRRARSPATDGPPRPSTPSPH